MFSRFGRDFWLFKLFSLKSWLFDCLR
jgi:hypothetical protein